MKTVVFGWSLALCCMAIAASVLAQGVGRLEATITDFSCELLDDSGVNYEVGIQHYAHSGVLATRFKLELGNGANLTYVSETVHAPLHIGNTQDGLLVCYGECVTVAVSVVTVVYVATGLTPGCGTLEIVPVGQTDGPEVLNCEGTTRVADAFGMAVFRRELAPLCPCPDEIIPQVAVEPGIDCMTVPVETTTWGAIKALYN